MVDYVERVGMSKNPAAPVLSGSGRSRRRPLLVSTALGCSIMVLAGAQSARAQSISQNSDTDISIVRDTVTAAPFAIDAISNGGNVTIDVEEINVTNNTTGSGYGVSAVTHADDKLISIDIGEINGAGTGRVFGIAAQTGGSDVVITSGSITAVNEGGYGIWGGTSTGDITIESGAVSTNGGPRSTSGGPRYAYGVWATTETGAISISSDTVTTTGLGATGVRAEGAGDVVIDSGAVSTAGLFAPGIHAAGHDIDIVSGQIETTGGGAPGIYVPVATGEVTIDSGTIATSGAPAAHEGVTYVSSGIAVLDAAGDVTIASDSVTTTGGGASAIVANSDGVVSVTGGAVSTAGNAAAGIAVRGAQGVSIIAGTTATAGGSVVFEGQFIPAAAIRAISAGGPVSVTSTEASTQGNGATGIWVTAATGDISILSGEVATDGDGANGITVANAHSIPYGARPADGGTGALSIDSGTITTAGDNAWGIAVEHEGAITIVSDAVDATVSGSGIYVYGGDVIDITSGSVSARAGAGIIAWGEEGDVSIDSGSISLGEFGSNAIYAQTSTGDIVINAGTTITTALGIIDGMYTADGVVGGSLSGDVSITSQTVSVRGQSAFGVAGFTDDGVASIISGSVTTAGESGVGVYASGGAGASVDSGSISTSGRDATGIWIVAGAGDVSITSDDIVTEGEVSNGITVAETNVIDFGPRAASGGMGAVGIDSGVITTTGNGAWGIAVDHLGPLTIVSDSITTTGDGASGIYVYGQDIDIDSGAIAVRSGAGIVAWGGTGNISIASDTIAMGAFGDSGIYAETSSGDVVIDAGTTTMTATGVLWDEYVANAVFASSFTGDTTITSDAASTVGDYGVAVGARGASIVIDSGVTSASGIVGRGVYARSRSGSTTVTSDSATASGDGGIAVFAAGFDGLTVTSGAAHSSGDRLAFDDGAFAWSHAVYGEAGAGEAMVTVGDTTATGAFADGVFLTANGEGGAINLQVRGDVSSAQATGVTASSSGTVLVDITSGNGVVGETGGLRLTGDEVWVLNAGLIENTGDATGADGAAIVANGPATLTNSGVIRGAGEVAVLFGAADDFVALRTGSSIVGTVVGGDGLDTVNLVGASDTRTQAQALAHFAGFEELYVSDGYWLAAGSQSEFDEVFILQDGILEVRDLLVDGEYEGAIGTGSVVNDGVLVLNAVGDSDDTDDFSITGEGVVVLAGPSTFHVTSDTIAHTGGTIVDDGMLVLTGTLQGDLIINEEGTFQLGDGGTAGVFQGDILDNGTLIFDRSDAYEFTGSLYGAGSLIKRGDSQLFLSGEYGFTGTTTVLGGTLKLANLDPDAELEVGGGTLDLSGGDHTVGGLEGEGGEIDIDEGSLTINTDGENTFGGEITGDGDLTIDGDGVLNLTGDNTYTGDTNIDGGLLQVNGSIVSDVFINDGGTLGGNGEVADVDVNSGGTVGPGNSIGLLTVIGDIAFGPGSFYEVEVNAAGQSDQIVATGEAVLTGGTVQVLAEAGTYNRLTTYTILTAGGGVDGTFAGVTSNFAYLTPRLAYTDTEVQLTLARNNIAFASVVAGANAVAVAGAVEAGGAGDDLYDLVLFQTDESAQAAFTGLSGEFHGAVPTALLGETRSMRETALSRLRGQSSEGVALWVEAFGGDSRWRGAGAWTDLDADTRGAAIGADASFGPLRLGASVAQARSDLDSGPVASRADVDSTHVAVYGGLRFAGLSARLGASRGWHDVETSRAIAFPGFADATTAAYEGTTSQAFAEAGYGFQVGGGLIEPFAGVALTRVETDGFDETGGAAALEVGDVSREVVFTSLGVRMSLQADTAAGGVASPFVSLAWGHASGDLEGAVRSAFIGSGEAFAVSGAAVAEDALLIGTGFDWSLSETLKARFAYDGALSDEADDHALRAGVTFRF